MSELRPKNSEIRPRTFGETVRFSGYDWPMAKSGHDIEGQSNGGRVIIPPGVNVWPHELKTAQALSQAGYIVEFIPRSDGTYRKSADAFVDGIPFELKSPESSRLSVVDKNVKKALSQSCNVVFDSKRMKNTKNDQVRYELEKSIAARRKIRSLLFVDKKRAVHRLK